MKPFERILVPTDFSVHSAEAVQYACDLSRRYAARMTLMHVFEPMVYPIPDGVFMESAEVEQLLASLEEDLEVVQREARSAGGHEVTTVLGRGVASFEIVKLAREGNFDVIVMGTHGRTGLNRVLMGSVAADVVRNAP